MTAMGPHQSIATESARDQFTAQVFDELWHEYRRRVQYVADYEQVVASHNATFFNDHIAFRTIASQNPTTGIASLSRIFEALGYQPAGVYQFPDKHLSAVHFQHPHPQFPKLFISELRSWELSPATCQMLESYLANHRPALPLSKLQQLSQLNDNSTNRGQLLDEVVATIRELPWGSPATEDVQQINSESQYAAWVLVHGYNVNHFTALINSHGVEELNTIDKTVAAMQVAGIPMKADVEGAPGSKLRQTATQAVVIDVPVKGDATMEWTYAYFELAERGTVEVDGNQVRFEGFLGPQATQLFEMTKKS